MVLLGEFDVFSGTLNHIHKIQDKVDIGESRVAEIGGRKSGFTIVKQRWNSTLERQCFFSFFWPTSSSTCKTQVKVDIGKCHDQKLIVFLLF